MTRGNYTTQVRVLLCDACGAPLEVAPQGGYVACGFCRAQNQVTQRRPDFAAPPPSAPIDENERLRRLRMQDGKPLVPPPSLLSLISGGSLHPAKVQEAFHIYQGTRKEVGATHSPDAAERLYLLTLIANTHLGLAGDDARRRALLETSLETLTLPRHVQVLRCLLASAAAKEGDFASAEVWIGPCNMTSDDIEADSAFRMARAFIDTGKGDFHAVIHCLGTIDDGYPIADTWDPTAAVLRGNALERLGDLNGAVNALRSRMGKEGHQGRAMMEKIIGAHPQLNLCPRSFPAATQGHSQVAAKAAGRRADGGIGSVFFFVGLGICAFGVILAGGLAIPMMIGGLASGDEIGGLAGLGSGLFSGFMALVTTVPLGGIFATIGFIMRKKAQRATWLRLNGIPAQGTVRGHSGTGMSINNVPVVEVEVDVAHPNAPPYRASFRQLLDANLATVLQPGNIVALRVHPERPTEIILEAS